MARLMVIQPQEKRHSTTFHLYVEVIYTTEGKSNENHRG
jgi:hypothetical protein